MDVSAAEEAHKAPSDAAAIQDANQPGSNTASEPEGSPLKFSEIEEEPSGPQPEAAKPLLKVESASGRTPDQNAGNWGWGLFASVAKAAENFTEAAVETAKEAAKSVADLQSSLAESLEDNGDQQGITRGDISTKSGPADGKERAPLPSTEGGAAADEDKRRKAALDKLESASKDSFLGHGLKVLDDSVENLALNAKSAFGSAWKGSLSLVHKLEQQAEALADSEKVKSGLKSSGGVLAKGTAVIDSIGRRAMELLAEEAGIELEKDESERVAVDKETEEAGEEVTFDRCFYIYGGPEHLEELEALSNHHSLVYNRARAKLAGEERASLEATLKELQKLLTLEEEQGGTKGAAVKKDDDEEEGEREAEIRSLREAGVSQASDMASSFATWLGSTSGDSVSQPEELAKKTLERLEEIKNEGVHRLSEFCALCISHLLLLGEAVLKTQAAEGAEASTPSKGTALRVDWPADTVKRAELIRERAWAMLKGIEILAHAFTASISKVEEAYKSAFDEVASRGSSDVEEKLAVLSGDLEADTHAAAAKLQDGLQLLVYPVLSTSSKGNL